jgi:hypothetical protein
MEIKDAVKELDENIKSYKDEIEKKYEKDRKEFEKLQKELKDEVKKLNESVAEKDGTIGDIQNEVKNLKAKGGRFSGGSVKFEGLRQTIANGIASALGERKAEIETSFAGELMKPIDIKTVANIASANLTGDNFISYLDWRPGMEPTGQFRFRNLVRTVLSQTDYVQFPRANTPIGEGSFGRQTEAATKPQVDRDYTMVDLTLKPMAAYAVVSRQSLRNILFLQSWLPESMMEQMEDAEDFDFGNALVAAATGSTSTTGFTGTPNVADKLVWYVKNNIQAKYNPTAIVADPNVWANLILLRPGTAGESYSGPVPVVVDTNGVARVLGRPVYPVNWLTGNRVVVGDFSKAAIVQSEGLRLRQSDSHASIFTSNEIAFLLERTENIAIFRPNAFITTTIS